MRDLRKDLEICNKATRGPWVFDEYDVDIWSQADPWRVANVGLHTDMEFIAEAREGWPYAIERAIKAEAENALLHKVADAAKELVTQINNRTKTMGLDMSNYHAISITVKPGDAGRDYWEAVWAFEQALAELDKEGDE